jgi:uncharacterized protein Veg
MEGESDLTINTLPNLSLRRGTAHSPRFSELYFTIYIIENDEQRTEADVVVMMFGVVMKHRPSHLGEG